MNWLESYLHIAFHHRWTRGEWFRLAQDEIASILAISASDSPGDLPAEIVALHARNLPQFPVSQAKESEKAVIFVEVPRELKARLEAQAEASRRTLTAELQLVLEKFLDPAYKPRKRKHPGKTLGATSA